MKVLVATEKPFAPVAVEGIRKVVEDAGYELELLEKYASKQELLNAVSNADALIIRSDVVDSEVLDAAGNLKIVVRAGAGYDNAVAELVFGMAVMAVRNSYNGTSGTELKGKRLGLQAYGQVGRNVARIAKGFGMEISAFDPYCPDEVMTNDGVKPVHSIDDLYSGNDIVSIHIPATPETRKSIGYYFITNMPLKGVLINTARKEVIDEDGLAKALRERPDIKYMADVKPDNADALKEEFGDRVFFTPKKMGAQTSEANINAGIAAARQVVAYLRDGVNKYQVNK